MISHCVLIFACDTEGWCGVGGLSSGNSSPWVEAGYLDAPSFLGPWWATGAGSSTEPCGGQCPLRPHLMGASQEGELPMAPVWLGRPRTATAHRGPCVVDGRGWKGRGAAWLLPALDQAEKAFPGVAAAWLAVDSGKSSEPGSSKYVGAKGAGGRAGWERRPGPQTRLASRTRALVPSSSPRVLALTLSPGASRRGLGPSPALHAGCSMSRPRATSRQRAAGGL